MAQCEHTCQSACWKCSNRNPVVRIGSGHVLCAPAGFGSMRMISIRLQNESNCHICVGTYLRSGLPTCRGNHANNQHIDASFLRGRERFGSEYGSSSSYHHIPRLFLQKCVSTECKRQCSRVHVCWQCDGCSVCNVWHCNDFCGCGRLQSDGGC